MDIETCNLPGRLLRTKRFCPHPEVSINQPSKLVSYDQCKTCPFRKDNTVVVQIDTTVPEPPPPKIELPSVTQQAVSAGKALLDFALSGFDVSTQTEQERRMDICRGCEFYIAEQNRCAKCGCYLALKSKLESGACPIGKW